MQHRFPADDTSLDLTPMIDVTFLLLIFFLCTLKFRTLEGKIAGYLPRDVGAAPSESELERVELRVTLVQAGERVFDEGPRAGQPYEEGRAERFRFEGRDVLYVLGPRRTRSLEQLTDWLRGLGLGEDGRVTLRAGPGTVYDDVVKALDAASAAGVGALQFASH